MLYSSNACHLCLNLNTVSVWSCYIYHAYSYFIAYDSVVSLLMNVFPDCSQSSQPKNTLQKPWTIILLIFIFGCVLACFSGLRNNFWHKHIWRHCRGRSWSIYSLGYLSVFLVWEVDLNQYLWRLFSPSLTQWLLEKLEGFSHP